MHLELSASLRNMNKQNISKFILFILILLEKSLSANNIQNKFKYILFIVFFLLKLADSVTWMAYFAIGHYNLQLCM